MFKFIKIIVLFIFVIGLVACSSAPTNVSKDVYNEIIKIQNQVDDCFNDEDCNYLVVNETVNNSLLQTRTTTQEESDLKMDTLDLLINLILYKTEHSEFKVMELELEHKKLHNKISEQLNKQLKYLQ